MFVWGKATEGELGLGGIEEDMITTPRWNKYIGHQGVREVACGRNHTMILMEDGRVLSCGNNNTGQLGQDTSLVRPSVITALDTLNVAHIACGHSHSIALTKEGQLYSWGDDSFGQLGLSTTKFSPQFKPKHVKALSKVTVVQVVCGENHTIALVQDGRVFSWGSNSYGQLALRKMGEKVNAPQEITLLREVPLVQVVAGGGHSFALSTSGALFGWGRNNFGQLGIGHQKDTTEPIELTTLRSHQVKYIACGDEHTAVLTADGGVFTFGAGGYGQLGHGSVQSSTYPTKVAELMGTTVLQIACGRCHTLALVKSTGQICAFGLGGSGQLGNSTTANCRTPTQVHGEWRAPESSQEETGTPVDPPSMEVDKGPVVKRVYAGGDQSFVSVIVTATKVYDCRVIAPAVTPLFLTFERVKRMLDLALIMKNTAEVIKTLEMVFSYPACLSGSFLESSHHETSGTYSGVNVEEAHKTFKLILDRLGAQIHTKLLYSLISILYPSLSPNPLSIECARLYYLLPAFVMQPPSLDMVVPYVRAFSLLDSKMKNVVGNWLFTGPKDYCDLWLNTMKTLITDILVKSKEILNDPVKNRIGPARVELSQLEKDLMAYGLPFLKCIHDWNQRHHEVIPYSDFHLKAIIDVVDLIADFFNWVENKGGGVIVFCRYPFVLDAQAKAELMKVESRLQMHVAVTQAQHQNLRSLVTRMGMVDHSPFALELKVHRGNLIIDTIRELMYMDERNFKKPLRVTFVGEEGLDGGGVQKEFFMLLLREILNPVFGMFVEDEESHLVWFREQVLLYERLDYFVLIGILCGLAIYNSVIIDLPFPTALYKKLLHKPTDLSDLKELRPSVGNSLQTILDYEGDDFAETFVLTFGITRSIFGEVRTFDLVPGGTEIPVTKDTKRDYVNAYLKYVLVDGVQEPYDAFAHGFLKVCGGEVLNLVHPEELKSLVVGKQLQMEDWNELEKYVQYKNGYSPSHPTIRIFWRVLNELPTEAKKKFLVFLTGSNRIPLAGIQSMQMIIQRMDGGPGCELLPVAHTCFNILDLPPYDSEEKMKQKLLQAINFTTGFGII